MKGITRIGRDIPVSLDGVAGTVAALVVLPPPEKIPPRPAILFCAPGGANSKTAFDLELEGDRSFSFAESMAAQGWIVAAIDPPGIGGSSPIEDGYLIGPAILGGAFHAAAEALKAEFRTGFADYPPLPTFLSVGVGASMGGMTIGWAQAHFRSFDAVVLLGSGPFGLAEHLPPPLQPLADNPAQAREEIAAAVKAMGLPAYLPMESPDGRPDSMFPGGNPKALAALRAANAPLLTVPGFFVLIPGSWKPEAEKIDVPLLLVYGDADILRAPHSAPASFKSSADITLLILEHTGHIHVAFDSMPYLIQRAGAWVRSMADLRAAAE